jgi:hypothetical protein
VPSRHRVAFGIASPVVGALDLYPAALCRALAARHLLGHNALEPEVADSLVERHAVVERLGQVAVRPLQLELPVRNEFGWRKRGPEPRCSTSRRPAAELSAEEREKYRRWWLEDSGLSARELQEIADGLGEF